MGDQSPELNAAIRAIQGADDLNAIMPAIGNRDMARVIACAPDAHPIVRVVAALDREMTALPDARMIADPALHAVMVRLIGHPQGLRALASWAHIAPVGSGRAHAKTIINNAAQMEYHGPFVTAALIGPCDESADLLLTSGCAASAIRRWGQSSPDDPTGWMHALSARARDRLLDAVSGNPYNIASCIPWLPPDTANQKRIKDEIGVALAAFAEASPTARARHAALVKRLVAQATSQHLGALTRLACAMRSKAVWRRVQTLIQTKPDDACHVIAEAPWDALAKAVRTAILEQSDQSDICAVIAAAQGRRDVMALNLSEDAAAAFFAALKPGVWDALGSDVQRQWRDALPVGAAHRAVRSLGLRPEFLAQAWLDNDLVRAVRTHTCDDATLHWTLFPVALRDLPPDAAHALITALPTPPPDPGAFFCVAGGWRGKPNVIPSARDALRPPDQLVRCIAVQRAADRFTSIRACCRALQRALRGWTWDNLETIAPILDDDARTAITPDHNALIERLAHPDRKDALRHALDRLTSLPPDIAVPSQVALHRWGTRIVNEQEEQEAAEAIADALRNHGDVFLEIVDALAHDRQSAALPFPWDKAVADALPHLAHDDPPSAQRLAYALRRSNWYAALHALLIAPPRHADAIWQSADESIRHAIIDVIDCPPPVKSLIPHAPIAGLALAALQSNNADLRNAGADALAAHPDVLRSIWDNLPQATQQSLRKNPDIAVVVADIPPRTPLPTARGMRVR